MGAPTALRENLKSWYPLHEMMESRASRPAKALIPCSTDELRSASIGSTSPRSTSGSPEWSKSKSTLIPKWAQTIVLVANGIDGFPPSIPSELSISDFLNQSFELQSRTGGGEWDVQVYAVEAAAKAVFYHPHGSDNPYCLLRRSNDSPGRVQKIANWSYMRWTFHKFVQEQ